MASSNLVFARMIYSESCHGLHAHDREPPALKRSRSQKAAKEVRQSY